MDDDEYDHARINISPPSVIVAASSSVINLRIEEELLSGLSSSCANVHRNGRG